MREIDGAQVVVIGGGATGLSSAWFMARAGADVVVIDKGVVGWEASGRNGGIVAYHRDPTPKGLMGFEEVRLWETLDAELGYPTEFSQGSVRVALDEETWDEMQSSHSLARKMGWRPELLSPAEVQELVPIVNPGLTGGWYDPDAGQANPQRTVQAYAWAFQDLGGRIYQHTTATGFNVQGDKVVSVETSRGPIGADMVVCAAGPQIGVLTEMVGAFVPVSPCRLEIIVTAPVPQMNVRGAVSGNDLYGRQTHRGNLAYGGGRQEFVNVDMATPEKPNTPLIGGISQKLMELFSGAEDIRVIRSWAGVSEQTPDDAPIIDFLDSPNNFLVASAALDGFSLSPPHGKAISELVLHGETTLPVDGYRLGRFADLPTDWREQKGSAPPPER